MCTDAYRAALARSFARTAAAPLAETPEPGRHPKTEAEADREPALGGSALGGSALGGLALGGSALGGGDGLDRQ